MFGVNRGALRGMYSMRHSRLTAKRGNLQYYKGGAPVTKGGTITKHGNFRVDTAKLLQLVVPDLQGFKLKPYVAQKTAAPPPCPYDISPLYQRGGVPSASS